MKHLRHTQRFARWLTIVALIVIAMFVAFAVVGSFSPQVRILADRHEAWLSISAASASFLALVVWIVSIYIVLADPGLAEKRRSWLAFLIVFNLLAGLCFNIYRILQARTIDGGTSPTVDTRQS